MKTRFCMRKLTTAVLVLQFIVFILYIPYNKFLLQTSVISRVASLDRAQVISETELREFDPTLVENIRYRLGLWICNDYVRAVDVLACIGLFGTTVALVTTTMMARKR